MIRETGTISLFWVAMVGVMAMLAMATFSLGLAYSARTRAQTASDASALAAAVATYPPADGGEPLSRARLAARENGAVLVSCSCPVDASLRQRVVTVVTLVRVDTPIFGSLDVRAASRAEFDPALWLEG